jgi:CHAD domain-containing protein
MAMTEIDGALAHLTDASPDRDEAIHEVRKRIKKIRAILRLVRDELGQELYRQENICYRDAGRRLADLRESAVLVETLDKLADYAVDELAAGALGKVRTALAQAHQSFSRRVFDEEKVVAATATTLRAGRRRLLTWPLVGDDFADVAKGVRRVYQRGRQRLAAAYAEPTPEAFHEWRKEVKYLWYQVTILELLKPGVLPLYAAELHELSDHLGDDHDLFALRRHWQQRPLIVAGAPELQQTLTALVERRRAEIEAAIRPLGERLYAEEPDTFMERINA